MFTTALIENVCRNSFIRKDGAADITLDDIEANASILSKRFFLFCKRKGPRVGDIFIFPDGARRRFTYDWGDSIQTTWGAGSGSFHFTENGGVSYSGGLEPGVSKDKLIRLPGHEFAAFWMFHRGEWRAHNAIYFRIPVRKWTLR